MNPVTIINQDDLLKIINSLSDKEGVFELCVREKNKRFRSFKKFALQNAMKSPQKDILADAVKKLDLVDVKIDKLAMMSSQMINMQKLGMVLQGVNLCATVAGFAMVYMEMEKINRKLDNIKKEVIEAQDLIKKFADNFSKLNFNEVLSEYNSMLDHEKWNEEYDMEKYRELADRECDVLNLLLDSVVENVSYDKNSLLFLILGLSSMLAYTVKRYDELYFYKHPTMKKGKYYWHISHDRWTDVFEKRLLSKEFQTIIEDYQFLDNKLSQNQLQLFISCMIETFQDGKNLIINNQILLLKTKEKEIYDAIQKGIDIGVSKEIDKYVKSYEETGETYVVDFINDQREILSLS